MNSKIAIVVGIICTLLSFPSFGETKDIYVFGDLGNLSSGSLCKKPNITFSSCSASSVSPRVGFGYSPQGGGFGVEFSYADLGEFSAKYASPHRVGFSDYVATFSVKGTAFSVPITYRFNLNNTLNFSLKLGPAFTQGKSTLSAVFTDGTTASLPDTSAGNMDWIYGIGINANIAENISVLARYELLGNLKIDNQSNGQNFINDLALFSLGAAYHF